MPRMKKGALPKPPGGRPKTPIPGRWRAWEIYHMLNSQLGLGYDLETYEGRRRLQAWWSYQLATGRVPGGAARVPIRKDGRGGGMKQLWTDEQVRRILTELPQKLSRSRE